MGKLKNAMYHSALDGLNGVAGLNVHAIVAKLVRRLELARAKVPRLALNTVLATETRLWNTSPALARTNHDVPGAPPMTTDSESPTASGTITDSATFTDTETLGMQTYWQEAMMLMILGISKSDDVIKTHNHARNGDDLTIRTRTPTFTGRPGLIAMPSAVLGKKRASANVSGFIPKAVWDLSSKCQTANATTSSPSATDTELVQTKTAKTRNTIGCKRNNVH